MNPTFTTEIDPNQLKLPLDVIHTPSERATLNWFLSLYPETLSYNEILLSLLRGTNVNGSPEVAVAGHSHDVSVSFLITQMNGLCSLLRHQYGS